MNNLLQKMYKGVTKKQMIIFAIIFGLFTAIVLPIVASVTASVIGVSESPDTSFNFSVAHLYSIVDQYGKEGRNFYILMRWTFDIVWPVIYTAFLVSVVAYLARKTSFKYRYRVLYIPLFAVLFDLLENTLATVIMAIYPTTIDTFVYLLFVVSMLKWIGIGVSFGLVLFLLIRNVLTSSK